MLGKLLEMAKATREKIPRGEFIFPEKRAWPIHDKKHAKIALVWATWPQHKQVRSIVVKKVLAKYPDLKGYGAAKGKGKQEEDIKNIEEISLCLAGL